MQPVIGPQNRIFKQSLFVLALMLTAVVASADPWPEHLENVQDLERNIFKLQQELDTLVEKKKSTRDKARIEETLQRIVEIHAELISYRKRMDSERDHIKLEHPDKTNIIDNYDSRTAKGSASKKWKSSPLGAQLDQLLIKVQMKFATFIKTEEPSKEIVAIEKVVEEKQKKKKEREADVYLRRRSKVKVTK